MSNFGRVLRLSLKHRAAFIASILSALVVGVLWGGNIGGLYPFIEMARENRNFQDWIAIQIQDSQNHIARETATIVQIEGELATSDGVARGPEDSALAATLAAAQDRRAALETSLSWYEYAQPYVERYVPRDRFESLVWLIGILFFSTLIKNLFQMVNTVLTARISYLATFELQKRFYARSLRMDVATFSSEGISDVMSRFTYDMQNLVGGLNALLGRLVREPLKMIACLIGAGWICWRLLVFSLIVAPVAAFLICWLGKTLKRANRRAMEEMSHLYAILAETFQGIKVVKAFTMERQERNRFHRVCKQYFRKSMKIAGYDALSRPLIEVMGIFIICLAILGGAYLVIEEQTHLLGIPMCSRPLGWSALLLFYGMLIGAADPARRLSDILTQLQGGVAAADRIYALLDREPSVRDPESPRPLARHHGDLVFEDVGFAYQPDHPILHDINLKIRFGETIAIVGPSGCGKSTLANLIPRFADPTFGRIRIDGIPLSDVRLRDLRGQIGLVTQDPLLFDDTVANNIRYGSPRATDAEVVAAAQRACAARFIEHELPNGYETEIGPLGGQLSGGQRQRIALARAVLRDPAVLILDEATSQVDLENEQIIQRVLEQFVRGRTVVIITHRMSALALADRIVVMREGRIVDVGAHAELMSRCDFYRRVYHIQFEDLRESA
jgi:subfamily B ATP-binding cassette protein MsbA